MEIDKGIKVIEKLTHSGHNQRAMAQAAGVSDKNVSAVVKESKKTLANILAEDDAIALKVFKVYDDALEAMRPVVTKDGIEYVPDWHARHKFSQDILVMRGWLKNGSSNVSNNQLVINLHGLAERAEKIIVEHPQESVDAEQS